MAPVRRVLMLTAILTYCAHASTAEETDETALLQLPVVAKGLKAQVDSVHKDQAHLSVGEPIFPSVSRSTSMLSRGALTVSGVRAALKANLSVWRMPTADEKTEFLSAHNTYRCMHGAPDLEWDDDLADGAESYVGPLTQMAHDDCYGNPPPYGPAGENIYWTSGTAQAIASVDAWYSEVNNCIPNPTDFTDGCENGNGVTGHFTAMIWAGAQTLGCGFSDDGHMALCRYKAGDSLSGDTPNMGGSFVAQVGVQSKSKSECASGSGNSGGSSGGKSAPAAPPPPPSGSCVTANGCKVTTSGCPGSQAEVKLPCNGYTLTLHMPSSYGPWDLSGNCNNNCGTPVLA